MKTKQQMIEKRNEQIAKIKTWDVFADGEYFGTFWTRYHAAQMERALVSNGMSVNVYGPESVIENEWSK